MKKILLIPRYSLIFVLAWITYISICSKLYGQELPPRPIAITVSPADGIKFGAFSHGNAGGTITVTSQGMRTATGDIILLSLGYQFSPAIIRVEGIPGTRINIANGTNAILSGSNGGTLTLRLGESSTGSPFLINTTPPDRMEIRVGGTLVIGNSGANPPGAYSGSFNITFIQE